MQIKGSTVLHVLTILLTLGEKEPFGNCQWQEDREDGGKKPTMLYEGSVASSLEQPLSIWALQTHTLFETDLFCSPHFAYRIKYFLKTDMIGFDVAHT